MNDLLPAPPERDLPPGLRASMRSELVRTVSLDSAGWEMTDRLARLHRPAVAETHPTRIGAKGAPSRRQTRTRTPRIALPSPAADGRREPKRRGRFLSRLPRRRGWAAGVALALTLALVVPLTFSGRGSSASAALLRLAETVGRGGGWESPAKGQFIYTRSLGSSPSCVNDACALENFRRESWIAPDGAGRIVELRGGRHSDQDFAAGSLPFVNMDETLGWSSDRLRRYVEGLTGQGELTDFELFVEIGQLMGETQLLPEMRIDLFHIAASLPDTVLLADAIDGLGRGGVGIGYVSEGIRYEVIFDEGTALVLEERVVAIDDRAGPVATGVADNGWLVPGGSTTYADSELVGSIGNRP